MNKCFFIHTYVKITNTTIHTYLLQSNTSQQNQETLRRYRDRKSKAIRDNYSLDEILHAAMLKLEEEGYDNAKIVQKKIMKDPKVAGDLFVNLLEEHQKQKSSAVKMPAETALAFLLHQVVILIIHH